MSVADTTSASRDVSQFVTNLLQEAGVSTQDPNELARLRFQLENLDSLDASQESLPLADASRRSNSNFSLQALDDRNSKDFGTLASEESNKQLELIQQLQLENQKLKRRVKELEATQQDEEHLPGCNLYVDKQQLTRHLIQRDKQRFKQNAGAQQILNDIQERLGLEISELHSGLDDIRATVEKVPDMKKFIYEVQSMVGAKKKSLDETLAVVRQKLK